MANIPEGIMIQEHLDEYRKQLSELQRQIIAITGAIQALERLLREQNDGK